MTFVCLVGARPNFIKFAALYRAFQAHPQVRLLLVHTGQHSGQEMSDVFFHQLALPAPDYFLKANAREPHRFMAQVIRRFGDVLKKVKPDAVLLVGDVNSTLAGAIAADKTGIPMAHIEAGLRSSDYNMPEEKNRRLTDHLAQWLFTTEQAANDNLVKEGIPVERTFFVGNVMIDTLMNQLPAARALDLTEKMGFKKGGYVLATIHRHFTLQNPAALDKILLVLQEIAEKMPVVFPVHPSTQRRLRKAKDLANLNLIAPLPYHEFLHLLANTALVITDSGGVQEESTCLGIPCLTYRPSTERPVTVTVGTNHLMYHQSAAEIAAQALALASSKRCEKSMPPLWDGHAAERIVDILLDPSKSNLS